MKFTGIEEVEDLHHDKDIKYKGKMPGIDAILIEHILIVVVAVGVEYSS